MSGISRRRLLLTGCLIAAWPSAAAAFGPNDFLNDHLGENGLAVQIDAALKTILPAAIDLREIGREARNAGLNISHELMHELSALARPPSQQATGLALENRIRTLIQTDLARGQTISVGGWIVSPTEASLCAFCAGPRMHT